MVSADGEAPLLPVSAPGTSLGRLEGEATDEENDEEDEDEEDEERDPVAVVRVNEMTPDDDDEDEVDEEDEREEEGGGGEEGESFLKNWETPDMTSPKRL